MHSKRSSLQTITPAVYEWVGTMVAALLVLVVAFTFFFRVVAVDGDSMNNTLKHGEQLLLSTVSSEYHHGDIVVVDRHAVEPLIKRVIAVSGDTVTITDDGKVLLNGQTLVEPYAVGKTYPRELDEPVRVPEGYVFVLGDNRENSMDSRYTQIGLIYEKDIIGKVVWRVSPFNMFGGVYNNMDHNIGG